MSASETQPNSHVLIISQRFHTIGVILIIVGCFAESVFNMTFDVYLLAIPTTGNQVLANC